jgi:hypothetical protein
LACRSALLWCTPTLSFPFCRPHGNPYSIILSIGAPR